MRLFHALNRGVEKRPIVKDDYDRWRFVHDLYEFNNIHNVPEEYRHTMSSLSTSPVIGQRKIRVPIVDIHAWCLMDNHYHLLLSERKDGAISLFLQRLNGGYARYFNKRHERNGALFQGKTKRKEIDSDAYFIHILNYIHCNPLDYVASTRMWRTQTVDSIESAMKQLETYRWSSYLDYVGRKNIPSILTKDVFQEIFTANRIERYLADIPDEALATVAME